MGYPKLAADEREATGPLRVPYPTGNNGIAQFYQFLASDVSFFAGICGVTFLISPWARLGDFRLWIWVGLTGLGCTGMLD